MAPSIPRPLKSSKLAGLSLVSSTSTRSEDEVVTTYTATENWETTLIHASGTAAFSSLTKHIVIFYSNRLRQTPSPARSTVRLLFFTHKSVFSFFAYGSSSLSRGQYAPAVPEKQPRYPIQPPLPRRLFIREFAIMLY